MKKVFTLLLVLSYICTMLPVGTITASTQDMALASTVISNDSEDNNNDVIKTVIQSEDKAMVTSGAAFGLSQSQIGNRAYLGITSMSSTGIIIATPSDWDIYTSTGITLEEGDILTIDAAAGSPVSAVKIQVSGAVTINGSGNNIDNLYIVESITGNHAVTINNLYITAPSGQDAFSNIMVRFT